MSRKVEVQLLDDIDGSPADETVTYGLDGTMYEVDLSAKHADKLRSALSKVHRKIPPYRQRSCHHNPRTSRCDIGSFRP